jgi:hypothetical protein
VKILDFVMLPNCVRVSKRDVHSCGWNECKMELMNLVLMRAVEVLLCCGGAVPAKYLRPKNILARVFHLNKFLINFTSFPVSKF